MTRDRRADLHMPSSHGPAPHKLEHSRRDDVTSSRRRRQRSGGKPQRAFGIHQAEASQQSSDLQARY